MGWIRLGSSYTTTLSSDSEPSEQNIDQAHATDLTGAKTARRSRRVTSVATQDLLDLASNGREPVNSCDPPLIPLQEVLRHDNEMDGICMSPTNFGRAPDRMFWICLRDRGRRSSLRCHSLCRYPSRWTDHVSVFCRKAVHLASERYISFDRYRVLMRDWVIIPLSQQFWRFHTKKHLNDWSSALLIGRTSLIPSNPFPEPPRWIKTS